MKKLFVLSHGRQTAQNISKDMEAIFGKYTSVEPICVEDGLSDIDFSDSLVLDTGKWMEDMDATMIIPALTKHIRARRVIDFRRLPELMDLPDGTDVLLVNDHQKTADIAIRQLIQLGLGHLNFYPYYPGIKNYRRLAVAVTPGEPHLVPDCVKQVIDLGTRRIDVTTLVETAEALGLLEEVAPTLSSKYVSDMFALVRRYNQAAKEASEMRDTFQSLADHSSSAIAYIDDAERIAMINKAFLRMAGRSVSEILGEIAENLIPEIEILKTDPTQTHVIQVFERSCVASIRHVERPGGKAGLIVSLEDADAIQRMEHELRRKRRPMMYTARYHFSEIHHKAQIMKSTIAMAKRVAKSDATILLQGESGTGKELLAQAIHNHSSRKNGPFVPVNFAALPESLVESELFGYEEGAFTGAKKGGAPGLFEAAHGGTLFLDEIADAPLSLQTRLLRVLQEKQVRRVGGRQLIPVDVRIIAASNKKLVDLINAGKFREDLYYRLCVVPIEVPSLRDRLEDVPVLLKMQMELLTMREVKLEDYLKNDALVYLQSYDWPGNIRQLSNLSEYLVNVIDEGRPIGCEHLPESVKTNVQDSIGSLILSALGDDLAWVLQKIGIHEGLGRRGLNEAARKEGLNLSEARLRTLLLRAHDLRLVDTGKGRAGNRLTRLGMSALKEIDKNT